MYPMTNWNSKVCYRWCSSNLRVDSLQLSGVDPDGSGEQIVKLETAKEGPTMLVTFDTNVWNRIVFPERYLRSPNYAALARINNAIRSGLVRGFICESFGTLEAIKPTDRAKFHAQSTPKVEVASKPQGSGLVSMTIGIKANHDLHPGLSGEFEEELRQALSIGMKLLSTPYIGLPVPARLRSNPDIYAPEVFATADYDERFGSVVNAIVSRGVGQGAHVALAKEFTERLDAARPEWLSDRELIYRVYEYARKSNLNKEKKQIEKVFAESADGDVVAAHVAFGNDFLCTEDRGGSAIGPSIFDDNNRTWLKTTYGVKILTAQQLSDLV